MGKLVDLPSPPVSLAGLEALACQYDAFLVDLWGVVHDGVRLFDGVEPALRELARARRRVVFVTNSSRTSALVDASLAELGVERALYEAVVSSGDVTRDALLARDPSVFAELPDEPACFHLGAPSFVPWLFDLGLRFVDAIEDADLVVATGTLHDGAALEVARERLAPLAARRAPMVCTNPDRVIPTATGLTLGPGAIAAAYAELGGPAFLYGKPHSPIYAAARRLLLGVPASRIVALGDLLDTDIRGARAAGLASVLVRGTGGGHACELGKHPDAAALDALFRRSGVVPDHVIDRFRW